MKGWRRKHNCPNCQHMVPKEGYHLHTVRKNGYLVWACCYGQRTIDVLPNDQLDYEYAEEHG